MPTYRLTTPGQPDELLEADSARREGSHTVLRSTAYVMGKPREVVLRRVPGSVVVQQVDGLEVEDPRSWAAPR